MKPDLDLNTSQKIKKSKGKIQCVYDVNYGCQNQCDMPILRCASCWHPS